MQRTFFAGSSYSEVASDFHSVGGVAFIENVATDKAGAMYVADYVLLQVGNAAFRSNKAESGGAVYLALAVDKETEFRTCVFEGNQASDGGAVYLYTGTGVDIFTDCVFQENFASKSPHRLDCVLRLRLAYTASLSKWNEL